MKDNRLPLLIANALISAGIALLVIALVMWVV